jgi:hypothetical protein
MGPRTATTKRPRHGEASTDPCCTAFEVDLQESHHQPLSGEQPPRSETQRR